jgi:hypothetical protein
VGKQSASRNDRSRTDSASGPPAWLRVLVVVAVFLPVLLLFFEHYYPCLKTSLAIEEGTLVSGLVAATALLGHWFEQWKSLPERLVGWLAVRFLCLAAAVGLPLALLVATSSVCVTFEGAQTANSRFEVRFDEQPASAGARSTRGPAVASLSCDGARIGRGWHELSLREPAWATRYFFQGSHILTFHLCETGKRYAADDRRLGMGGSLRVRVPADFIAKEFHVIRLLPWTNVLDHLDPPDSVSHPGAPEYLLHVSIDGAPFPLAQLRMQPVYFGASDSDLSFVIEGEGVAQRRDQLMQKVGRHTEEIDQALQDLANAAPRTLATTDLRGGESVEVSWEGTAAHGSRPLLRFKVDERPGIQTVLLEDAGPPAGGASR